MKVLAALLLFTLLVGSYAQTCTYTKTVSGSIVPTSDSIFVQSLDPMFDNFNINWDVSFTNEITATLTVCSSSQTEFNAFSFDIKNNNGVFVSLQRSTATGTTSTGGSSTTTVGISNSTSTTGSPTAQPNAGSNLSPSLFLAALAACLFAPNKRISVVILAMVAAFLMASPSANASIASTNTKITLTIAVPSSMNNFCVSGQCWNRTSNASITKYISLFGKRFSGMGGWDTPCNNTINVALNPGWVRSAHTAEANLAILLNGINTYDIITSDNTGYRALENNLITGYGQAIDVPNAFGTGVTGYRVQNCDAKLLITQDFPAPEPSTDIIAPPRIAPANLITFNGFDYGVADNIPKSQSTSSCPTLNGVYIAADSAWSVAPNDDAAYIAIAGDGTTFGSTCLNFADFSTYTSPWASGECNANTFYPISYGTGNIYVTPNCSRIVVKRASTLANSWVIKAPAVTRTRGNFALLSNDGGASAAEACQTNFMAVPDGWRLTTAAELDTEVRKSQWAVYTNVACYATVGGSLFTALTGPCSNVVTKTVAGVNYYKPVPISGGTCGQILITKQ